MSSRGLPGKTSAGFAGLQVLIALGSIGALVFAPPAHGRMLLVPLTDQARARLVSVARAHDALLLGSGPIGGSLIVTAPRDGLARASLDIGVIAIAAPAALCGELITEGDRI